MKKEMKNDRYRIASTEKTQLGRFCIRMDWIEKEERYYPYSYVQIGQSVSVLPFVGEQILLIKQFRYCLGKWMYEIPGGGVEKEESPLEAAKREMAEETGFEVERIIDLGSYYPSPGSSDEKVYLFAAKCQKDKKGQRLDPLEAIQCELVTVDKFRQMIWEDNFMNGMGLAAWAKYIEKREKLCW